jgi:hypothetical protein
MGEEAASGPYARRRIGTAFPHGAWISDGAYVPSTYPARGLCPRVDAAVYPRVYCLAGVKPIGLQRF